MAFCSSARPITTSMLIIPRSESLRFPLSHLRVGQLLPSLVVIIGASYSEGDLARVHPLEMLDLSGGCSLLWKSWRLGAKVRQPTASGAPAASLSDKRILSRPPT